MKHSSTPQQGSSHDIVPLLEFSTVVNSSLDLTFILNTLLLTIMGKVLSSKGMILLRKDDDSFIVANIKGVSREIHHVSLTVGEEDPVEIPDLLWQEGITRLFPIVSHDKTVALIGLSERIPLTEDQITYITTLLNISAAAIEKGITLDALRASNKELDGKVYQLKTLFELAKEFSGMLDEDRLIRLFSLTLMGQVGTSRYALCLKNGRTFTSKISKESIEGHKHYLLRSIVAPIVVDEEHLNSTLVEARSCLVTEKIQVIIPLQIQNEVQGILCLGERLRGGTYQQSDLEFIYSLSNLAFISLENARLFQEAVEKQRLENELVVAKEIQKGLLPWKLPDIEGYQIDAINVSSKQVGGDYYDVIQVNDSEYIFAIGDVSGKGTPASLLMANVQATLRTLVPFNIALPDATARINDIIYSNTGADKFITFFWGKLMVDTGEFRYVNAGHNPPYLLKNDGSISRLEEGGIILGVMKTLVPYAEGSVRLSPGDSIIFFTDGVSEAMDVEGIDYTEERLEQFLLTLSGTTAAEKLEQIKNEIIRYTSGAVQSDDITLMVLQAK